MVWCYSGLQILTDGFGTRLKEHQKAVFLCKKENSALSEHTCLTNRTIGWDNSKIITTNRRYHLLLCLEARHINSAHAFLNRDDGGLLPDAYLHLVRTLISDHIKGPLVAALRSPLMKALDRSVETLGLWIVTSSVAFIKSTNQSSIKLCLTLWSHCYKKIKQKAFYNSDNWLGPFEKTLLDFV